MEAFEARSMSKEEAEGSPKKTTSTLALIKRYHTESAYHPGHREPQSRVLQEVEDSGLLEVDPVDTVPQDWRGRNVRKQPAKAHLRQAMFHLKGLLQALQALDRSL